MKHNPLSIATMRALCIDMINKANSGHPGMALDAAPIMYALFHDHMIVDPAHPDWINRDRFVLSAGHVSSLLYATMHLAGYPLSIQDIKSFRQLIWPYPWHRCDLRPFRPRRCPGRRHGHRRESDRGPIS